MNLHDFVVSSTNSNETFIIEEVQELWSGYGKILRYELKGSDHKTVIVKHIKLEQKSEHPRGWEGENSHQRKLKSYQVELNWYKNFSDQTNSNCRIPKCLALKYTLSEMVIILEDLNQVGYPKRCNHIQWTSIQVCIKWLANFHALFLNTKPQGLWKTGTYWHLDTRPDELKALKDIELKNAAFKIDELLTQSKFQTLVHGDAKLANFCFSQDETKVAVVDFQYVGGGCGMKDLVYFIGSCMNDKESEQKESQILEVYFNELQSALQKNKSRISFNELELDWRSLYHVAWADFHRFIKGWSPSHHKINDYSERVTREVIESIKNNETWY